MGVGWIFQASNYNFTAVSSTFEIIKTNQSIAILEYVTIHFIAGKYLPGSSYGCLKVSPEGDVTDSSCQDDDLSFRWLWTNSGQILNLETLKCLRVQGKSLTVRQCDRSVMQQLWKCKRFPFRSSSWFIVNEKERDYRNWIRYNLGSSYIMNCNDKSSYQGNSLMTWFRITKQDVLQLQFR